MLVLEESLLRGEVVSGRSEKSRFWFRAEAGKVRLDDGDGVRIEPCCFGCFPKVGCYELGASW